MLLLGFALAATVEISVQRKHVAGWMQAVDKRHSTFDEAMQVAQQCRAGCTLLTHFSQRYPKLLPHADVHERCLVAHDGMQLKLDDLKGALEAQVAVHRALLGGTESAVEASN